MATLLRNAPPESRDAPYPPPPSAEAMAFLAPGHDIPSADPAFVRLARREIGDERRLLPAVARLAGWVHQAVRHGAGASARVDPRVVLETGAGDCTGHAALMTTLCRAADIPARRCLGLLLKEDRLVYHAWVEVWAGSVWMPVDTTVNRVGLPAGYLLTRREDEMGEWGDPFAWRLREGGLSASLRAAAMETPGRTLAALTPGAPESYRVAEGDWRADLHGGYSFRVPPGWTSEAAAPGGPFAFGNGRGARLTVEALDAAWKATPEGVDRFALQLSKTYARFRRRDGGVVTRPDGVAALELAFTCEERDATLRSRQMLVPRRGRTIRLALWAAPGAFAEVEPAFERLAASLAY